MNWYVVVSIVAAFLAGWAIGITVGTSQGYAAALDEYQRQAAAQQWTQYFKQFNGGTNGKEE